MKASRTVTVDGHEIDTSSREWMLICLARQICKMPTTKARDAFVEGLAKKWPENDIKELRELMRQEWYRLYPRELKQQDIRQRSTTRMRPRELDFSGDGKK